MRRPVGFARALALDDFNAAEPRANNGQWAAAPGGGFTLRPDAASAATRYRRATERAQSALPDDDEYQRLLEQGRKLEGLKAAVRDPLTGKIMTGRDHNAAFYSHDKDAQARIKATLTPGRDPVTNVATNRWNYEGPNVGFTRGGSFFSRQQVEDMLKARDDQDLSEALHGASYEDVRSKRSSIASTIARFHNREGGEPMFGGDRRKVFAHDAIDAEMAFDEAQTTRSYDPFGRLNLDLTPISKATVNPYQGKEIPDWQKLKLDPEKVYMLLRHPDELKRAAASFNNVPLLYRHKPTSAENHPRDLVVGTTGERAVYQHPYLYNSMSVWDDNDGIEGIENNKARALSCGYAYDPDMRPGVYEGQRYDGVMRNIRGNHVILTKEGRAGPDIIVGDSMENLNMATAPKLSPVALVARRAVRQHLTPLMAADAAIDITPAFVGLKQLDERSQQIVHARVGQLVRGKLNAALAMDDVSAGLRALLEALGGGGEPDMGGGVDDVSPPGTEAEGMPETDLATGAEPDTMQLETDAAPPEDTSGGNDPPPMQGAGGDPAAMEQAGPAPQGGEGAAGPIEKVRSYLMTVLNPAEMQHLELLISEVDSGDGGEPDPTMQAGGSEKPGGGHPPMAGAGGPPGPDKGAGGPPMAAGGPPKPPGAGGPPPKPGAGGPPDPKKQTGDNPPRTAGTPQVGGKDRNMAGDQAFVSRADLQAALAANDKLHRERAEARAFIRPFVGELTGLAMDAAPNDVIKAALKIKGMSDADLKPIQDTAALKLLLGAQSKAEASRERAPRMALDSKATSKDEPFSIEAVTGLKNFGRIGRAA